MKRPTRTNHTPISLFLVGVARTGTSYLQKLLHNMSDIKMSYEGKIVVEAEYYYKKYLKKITGNTVNKKHFFQFLDDITALEKGEPQNRWLIQEILNNKNRIFETFQANSSYAGLVENLYMQPQNTPIWGNKILRAEFCDDIIRHWPNAKFIVLIRDPRATYVSQVKQFGMRLGHSTIYWNFHANWAKKNLSQERKNYHLIRFEDLITNTGRELCDIRKFIGLPNDSAVEQVLEKFPPKNINRSDWKKQLTQEETLKIEQYCFNNMVEFNYDADYAISQKEIPLLRHITEIILESAAKIPLDLASWRRKKLLKRFIQSIKNSF